MSDSTRLNLIIYELYKNYLFVANEWVELSFGFTFGDGGNLQLSDIQLCPGLEIIQNSIFIRNIESNPGYITGITFQVKILEGFETDNNFVTIDGNEYNFLNGDKGENFKSESFRIDSRYPTLKIDVSNNGSTLLTNTSGVEVIFTFSEAVLGFDADDISITNAVGKIEFIGQDENNPRIYKAIFTPFANINQEKVVIEVKPDTYTDIPGNAGLGAYSAQLIIDTHDSTAPTPVISIPGGIFNKNGMDFTVSFDEFVGDFDAADIVVSAGSISLISPAVNMSIFTFHYSPDIALQQDSEIVSINVLAGGYADLSGNFGLASEITSFTVDVVSPTLTIKLDDAALSINESSLVTFAFSEAVKNFTMANVSLSQAVGLLDNFQAMGDDFKIYTAIFIPDASIEKSDIKVKVSGEYTDSAGNAGVATVSSAFAIDTMAPSTSISVSDTHLTRGESLDLTFTFSEAVKNFSADDVLLDGAAVNLTQFTEITAGQKFTAVYTPVVESIDANNIFSVAASSYTDLAGNAGTEAQSINVSIDTVGKILFGTTASDLLIGTAGADRISGIPQSGEGAGKGSIDFLLGLGGADVFLLGNHDVAFYNDRNNSSAGTKDFAAIVDFSKAEGDKIEVKAGTYFFCALSIGKSVGTGLYLDTNNSGAWDAKDELIGFLVGVNPSSVSVAQDLLQV